MIAPICPRKGGRVGLISKHSNFWKWYKIYPYSSNERPFKKNAGQVRDDKSPVKLMTVLMNSLNWLPVPGSACLMDIESTSLTVGDRSPLVSFSFLLMLPKKLLPMTKEKGKKTIEKGKEKKEKKKRWPKNVCSSKMRAGVWKGYTVLVHNLKPFVKGHRSASPRIRVKHKSPCLSCTFPSPPGKFIIAAVVEKSFINANDDASEGGIGNRFFSCSFNQFRAARLCY